MTAFIGRFSKKLIIINSNSPAMASGRLSVATSSEPRGMEDAGGDSVERHATFSSVQP